ncbi:hypothetical protein EBZ39_06275 [bacterium]|nr:hypothetical protein [bacterium]
MLRPLYALFGALAAASLTACLPLGEMYLIEQTPLVPFPTDGEQYIWDESAQSWTKTIQP